jgi:hypothetical protein
MGDTGSELSLKTQETCTSMSACPVFVLITSRTKVPQNNPLATWLNACPVDLDDRQQEIIRQIVQMGCPMTQVI